MKKWKVRVGEYREQFKVGIPKELARLGGLHKCEYVELGLNGSGKIIMEAFDARGNRKVQSKSDQFGVN